MPATHANAGIAAWNFKLKGEIHSYEDCEAFLGGVDEDGRTIIDERALGPKMSVGRNDFDGCLSVVLYATEIIRYYPDGTFSVSNGGFNTPTTTARLDAVLPPGFRAFHKQKQLGLNWADELWPLDHDKRIDPKTKAFV